MSAEPIYVSWYRPLTLADVMLVEAMEPDVRAAVERYARKNAVNPVGATEDTEYERGWQDAMERMEDELQSVYFPEPPSKDERERKRRREEERKQRLAEAKKSA